MAKGGGFARRFIAGENVAEAVAAVHDLPGRGLRLTLDYLGESVASGEAAAAAAAEYVHIIEAIVQSGIERNISLKLTQLGLDVDRATAVDQPPGATFHPFVALAMLQRGVGPSRRWTCQDSPWRVIV